MKGLDTFGAVVKYLSQDIWYRDMFGGCELLGTGVESYIASNSDLVPVPRPNQGVSNWSVTPTVLWMDLASCHVFPAMADTLSQNKLLP